MALALRLATDAEKIQRDHVTFPEWGTRLTLDQYLERERVLREHPFSRGMRTWLLVDGGDVLGSCETFDNVSRVGSAAGTSWSIASRPELASVTTDRSGCPLMRVLSPARTTW